MNPLFQKLMGQAAQLTGQGDLQGATAAIQEALMGRLGSHRQPTGPQAADGQDVIDVQAREVPTAMDVNALIANTMQARPGPAMNAGHKPHPQPQPQSHSQPMPDKIGDSQGRIERGTYAGAAGQRDWRLYVPPADQRGQALPLVVMLHGCTQDPDDFAAGTGMDEAARRQGFFVLYPAQAQSANPQRCWNWFKHNHQQRDRGEPALLAGLTREVIAKHGIDPRRVYVAGLSAGGAMAAILGDTYPDIYAAVGVHSGLAAGAANDLPSALAAMQGSAGAAPMNLPGSHGLAGLPGLRSVGLAGGAPSQAAPRSKGASVPTIVFHGDQDHTVHAVNAEHIVAACTGPAANDGQAARLSEERARSPNGRSYTRRLHTDAHGKPVAEHWVVHGAGHAWSGGAPHGSYTDASGPDATAEMLRFFFANPGRPAM